MLIAVKLCQVYLFAVAMGLFPDGKARGYLLVDELIKLLELDVFLLQPYGLHAAADVNSHKIGDDLFGDGHGGTDGTACACVNIGHDADLCSLAHGLAAKCDDLSNCVLFDVIGKDLG